MEEADSSSEPSGDQVIADAEKETTAHAQAGS
jgi:hypothetical protein